MIESPEGLRDLCDQLEDAPLIGFDTEFVSEDRYRPELCLIQVVADGELSVIDPYTSGDTTPFWDILATPGKVVIAHACREESRFCYRFTGKPIAGLFDVQLAAGFAGMDYPASLGNLVQRLLGKSLPKGETRTNWRKRPLTQGQITYALHDVSELEEMYRKLHSDLERAGRLEWLAEEVAAIQNGIIEAEQSENWRRVSGASNMSPRQMAIVRELWRWREDQAEDTDTPPRRILRDDLIIELAKRGRSDIKGIKSLRGMERRGLARHYEEIADAIAEGNEVPEADLPRRMRGNRHSVAPMLSQFLVTSMACISRQHQIAPSILGNADDVRELIAHELENRSRGAIPNLLRGWRAGIIGQAFRELLEGRLAIRVADVNEEQPLEFIRTDDS